MRKALLILLAILGVMAYPSDIISKHVCIEISAEIENYQEPIDLQLAMVVIRNTKSKIITALNIIERQNSIDAVLVEEVLSIKAIIGSKIPNTSSMQVLLDKSDKGTKRISTVINLDYKEYSRITITVEEIDLGKYGIKRIYSNNANTETEIEYMKEVVKIE